MSATREQYQGAFTGGAVFRMKPSVAAICLVIGVVWIALLVFYANFLSPIAAHQLQQGRPLGPNEFRGFFVCAIGLIAGIWLISMPFTYELILRGDRIEERYFPLPKLRMTRADIAGKRVYPSAKNLSVILYPTDRKRRPMQIWTGQFRNGKLIEDWISSLPDVGSPHKDWRILPTWQTYAFMGFFGIPLLYTLFMILLSKMGFWYQTP